MFQDSSPETNSNFQLKTRITEKLNKIQEDSEFVVESDPKVTKLETFYSKVNEKIRVQKLWKDREYSHFQQDILKIEENMKRIKRNSEKNYDKESSQFQILEKKMMNQTNSLSEDIKIVRKALTQTIDKQFKKIKLQAISTLNQDFQSLSKQHQSQVNERIAELSRQVQDEQNSRNSTAELLINSFGQQVLKLQQAISLQKHERVESNLKMKNCIKDMEDHISELFEEEERESQLGRQSLQKRLQEVIYKIQAKVLGKN